MHLFASVSWRIFAHWRNSAHFFNLNKINRERRKLEKWTFRLKIKIPWRWSKWNHISISKAPFLTIWASFKRWEWRLSNEANIVNNDGLRDRGMLSCWLPSRQLNFAWPFRHPQNPSKVTRTMLQKLHKGLYYFIHPLHREVTTRQIWKGRSDSLLIKTSFRARIRQPNWGMAEIRQQRGTTTLNRDHHEIIK